MTGVRSNAPMIQGPVTSAQFPDVAAAERRLSEREKAFREAPAISSSEWNTKNASAAIAFPIFGIAASAIALGGGAKAGAALLGGFAAGAVGSILAWSVTNMDATTDKQRLGRARGPAGHEVSVARSLHAVGADGFNKAGADIVGKYDHDGDGAVSLAPIQPYASDERMRQLEKGGPAGTATAYVQSQLELLTEADQDHDLRTTPDEVAQLLFRKAVDGGRPHRMLDTHNSDSAGASDFAHQFRQGWGEPLE